jgi:hypothetical protein
MVTPKIWQLSGSSITKFNLKATESSIQISPGSPLTFYVVSQSPTSTASYSSAAVREERMTSIRIAGTIVDRGGADANQIKERRSVDNLVSKYIPDCALYYTKNKYGGSSNGSNTNQTVVGKPYSKSSHSSAWHKVAVISISLKNSRGWKQDDGVVRDPDTVEAANKLQLAYTIVVKWNKARNMETMTIMNGADKSVTISCMLGLPPYNSTVSR